MNGRPFTRADYLAIKSATRRACEDAGPLHQIADSTRADPAALSRYGNADRPEFIPIDIAMDLDALSGGDRILRAWAELRGYELIRDEKGVAIEDTLRHVGEVGRAAGQLHSTMCEAVADGKVTPLEAARIERAASVLDDANENLSADMRRIQAKGGAT